MCACPSSHRACSVLFCRVVLRSAPLDVGHIVCVHVYDRRRAVETVEVARLSIVFSWGLET